MDIIETLRSLNGYWKYNGGRYLAKLENGKMSDTYCDTEVLTRRPKIMSCVCGWLIYKWANGEAHLPVDVGAEHPRHDLSLRGWASRKNLYVCGSAMGSVTLAYEVARQLGATAIFTEPVYDIMDGKEYNDYVGKTSQELKRYIEEQGMGD